MIDFVVYTLIFPGFASAFFAGFIYYGILRKVTAHMQHRIGPPVWQPFLDFVKLLAKENITPDDSTGFVMTLCPIVSFASLMTVLVFIPFNGYALVSFSGSILIVIYLLVMASAFIAIAGFATGNPFGKIGSVRELTQLIAYEFPFIVSLLTIGFLTNFKVSPFVALQFPFAFVAFVAGMQGKFSLPPFHIPEAEQEIVAGPFTEYSGPRLAMFELAKAASFWVLISLGSVMFMGASNIFAFFINSFVLLFAVMVMRAVFARLRIQQAFRLYWFVIAPLAIIDFVRVLTGLYW
ncbi:MAG: NADH-quinone oxidoreductase subunit H [Candidatus Aenigmarchaeota archaeon]|nr:NADH-quinone oxidoreductase subunit H [Candidatus Aenigmarchaeota archaeon]